MRVSVLTPTYNDAVSIGKTYESIRDQTHIDWEWIIINDGSTDNTECIVTEMKENNDRIKYIKQENSDQLNAIIAGLQYVTGDFIFILHSDDLLPTNTFFEDAIRYMEMNKQCEALYGDLVLINEFDEKIGMQKVKRYKQEKHILPLQLLWLGRNLYSDVAFHRKEPFFRKVKNNYLLWNTPLWLDFTKNNAEMLRMETWDKPVLKYRIHSGNYINNDIGKLNVLNGELRTAIQLMEFYNIPFYGLQYYLFRICNKIGLPYHIFYMDKPTKNQASIIRFIVKKRLKSVQTDIYVESIYEFYNKKSNRVLEINRIKDNVPLYYGKDVRIFNRDLKENKLNKFYLEFMDEMKKGFGKIIVPDQDTYKKMVIITKFMCIENIRIEIKNK